MKGPFVTLDSSNPVERLSEDEIWDLLLGARLGRLAVTVAGRPDIYPVNFLAHDRRILIRTNPGDKLVQLTINSHVALECDGQSRDSVWSVVVKGRARLLETEADIAAAESLRLRPWTSEVKTVFVDIDPDEVTGRRLHRGPEPEA
jgi:nitroimidazol reductase NimA-like FMN-containing flavoprotein (pyridoxamine 5'-phosphate oxidase superfamily)